MLGLPSRAALAAFRQAVREVSEFHSVGFVRNLDDVRVSMFVEHPNGVSEHALPRSDIPSSLRPTVGAATQEETNWIGANPTGVAEWLLALGNVRRVASFRVPNVERPPCDTGATIRSARPSSRKSGTALDALRAASHVKRTSNWSTITGPATCVSCETFSSELRPLFHAQARHDGNLIFTVSQRSHRVTRHRRRGRGRHVEVGQT